MKKNYNKSHKVANKNNNVELERFAQMMIIHVPYDHMADVMEGLEVSSADNPFYTALCLEDKAYGIKLFITWCPKRHKENTDYYRMNSFVISLFLHDEEIRQWLFDKDEYPSTINYEAMHDFIIDTVSKEIEKGRKSGEDLDNDKMMDRLNGHMFKVPAFPRQIVEESFIKLTNYIYTNNQSEQVK